MTSIANLGTFSAGDTLQIQFIVGNDTNTSGIFQPNWQIDAVSVDGPACGVPDGGATLALLGLSLSGLAGIRRFVARR